MGLQEVKFYKNGARMHEAGTAKCRCEGPLSLWISFDYDGDCVTILQGEEAEEAQRLVANNSGTDLPLYDAEDPLNSDMRYGRY